MREQALKFLKGDRLRGLQRGVARVLPLDFGLQQAIGIIQAVGLLRERLLFFRRSLGRPRQELADLRLDGGDLC